jgi:hypothetical protein
MDKSPSHLLSTGNQDGAAVLDTRQGTITTLNLTGAFIWQALERGESEDTIAARLATETGASGDIVARDVRDFVAALREQDIFPA